MRSSHIFMLLALAILLTTGGSIPLLIGPSVALAQSARGDSLAASTGAGVQAAGSQAEAETLPPKFAQGAESSSRFHTAVMVASVILVVWLVLVILYLIWGIHFYVYNFGISNHEWKVLHPELYAKPGEMKEYVKRRDELQKNFEESPATVDPESDVTTVSETKLLPEPEKNPYERDSFGLPPGTIRGVLALTALVMFLLIEGVNLYAPANLEGHFDGLITALQMVLAFYFGSKAVEALGVIKKDEKAAPAEEKPKFVVPAREESLPEHLQKGESYRPQQAGQPTAQSADQEPQASPSERPAMSSSTSSARAANIMAVSGSVPSLPSASLKVTPDRLTKDSPLLQRVLALTASFETSLKFPDCFGAVSGNFDGQGISYGALQWNFGQGSLQPILRAMSKRFQREFEEALGDQHSELASILDASKEEQLSWAQRIQFTRTVNNRTIWSLTDRWKEALKTLGKTPGMIQLQVENADARFQIALQNCARYGLTTERGLALMFDINVQNGAVDSSGAGARIREDFATIDPGLPEEQAQVERMKIVATRRSEVSNPKWREDVKRRKMTIAEGTGVVHGKPYDLQRDYAIGLDRFMKESPAPMEHPAVAA